MILHTVGTFTFVHVLNVLFLYLGPGMDGGMISMIVAFLISTLTFLISLIWYPIKKTSNFFKSIFNKIKSSSAIKEGKPDDK